MIWLGITVLLLVVGYVWLAVYAGRPSEALELDPVRKLTPAAATAQSSTYKVAQQKQDQMPITRDNDSKRADEYLAYEAVENEILPLLDAADVQFENEQYVSPPGNNAWESYLAILDIDPEETIAKSGLTKIKSKLIGNAESAIDGGDFEGAESWLVQLDQIQPNDTTQSDLRAEISTLIEKAAAEKLAKQEEEARQEKIRLTLAQAKEEEEKEDIKYNNIKDLYQRVLELDEENSEAAAGLRRLSDRRLDEVEALLKEDKLDEAKQALESATTLDPDNKRVGSLNLALNASLKQRQREELAEKEQERISLARQTRIQEEQQETQQQTTQAQNTDLETPESTNEPAVDLVEDTQPASIIASGTIGAGKNNQPVDASTPSSATQSSATQSSATQSAETPAQSQSAALQANNSGRSDLAEGIRAQLYP